MALGAILCQIMYREIILLFSLLLQVLQLQVQFPLLQVLPEQLPLLISLNGCGVYLSSLSLSSL